MDKEIEKQLIEMYESKRAVPASEPRVGGRFYKIMSQDFRLPNGEIITREFVDKKRATVIVPVTVDGKIVFVYQPTALTAEGALLELPAGYVEGSEDTIEAGIRELAEETGYRGDRVVPLGYHYQDPGSIKTPVDFYAILDCVKVGTQDLDDDEHIESIEISLPDTLELLDNNEITDANTNVALFRYERYAQKSETPDRIKTFEL